MTSAQQLSVWVVGTTKPERGVIVLMSQQKATGLEKDNNTTNKHIANNGICTPGNR